MNAIIDMICGVVWHLHRSRVIRAEERAKLGTWVEAKHAAPTLVGKGTVRWSARSA
jgi:hypothetical protein